MESLGGYKLVRKVGDGARAELFLAHPIRLAADAVPAAVKVFRSNVSAESIQVEIEALSRSAGAHSLELIDLTTAPDGRPALVLRRYASGSVAKLARARTEFRPGEAMTMLAPITVVLRRLHDNGVVHGAIRPDAVLFDAAGSPTLGCFGNARLFAAGMSAAVRGAEPAFSGDLDAMKALSTMVLGLVRDDATFDALEWLDRSDPQVPGWLDALDDHLFALGEPSAIDLQPPAAPPTNAVPSRVMKAEAVVGTPVPAVFAGVAIPEVLTRLLSPRQRDKRVAAIVRTSLSSVRPRFWAAGCAVILALGAAVVLIPQGKSGAVETLSQTQPTSASALSDPSPVAGDDPVAAAVPLLETREACIRDMSVLCLDAVVQPESAASMTDRELIRSIQDGQESPAPWLIDSREIILDERLGDSAILTLGDVSDDEPASLLLMKTEAGWRIRDYLQQ